MGTSATHGLKNGPDFFATQELNEVLVTNGFGDILTFFFPKVLYSITVAGNTIYEAIDFN